MTEAPFPPSQSPLVGVGAVIWNDRDEIVLIRRGKAPRLGEWSIPGGHLEWDESLTDAVLREVKEETGLDVEIAGLIDVVDSLGRNEAGTVVRHHVLVDFAARWLSGEICAGGDALEARWVPYATLGEYALWDETLRVIAVSARARQPKAT